MILKEAIHNIAKYSKYKEIKIFVHLADANIDFSIEDDGIGFDQLSIKKGNGLQNMKKRMADLHGFFEYYFFSGTGYNRKWDDPYS